MKVPIVNQFHIDRRRRAWVDGLRSGLAKFEDEAEKLRAAGASTVFNFYTEAGVGFAAHDLSEHTATS